MKRKKISFVKKISSVYGKSSLSMKCPIYAIVIYEMSFYEMSQRQTMYNYKTEYRRGI